MLLKNFGRNSWSIQLRVGYLEEKEISGEPGKSPNLVRLPGYDCRSRYRLTAVPGGDGVGEMYILVSGFTERALRASGGQQVPHIPLFRLLGLHRPSQFPSVRARSDTVCLTRSSSKISSYSFRRTHTDFSDNLIQSA